MKEKEIFDGPQFKKLTAGVFVCSKCIYANKGPYNTIASKFKIVCSPDTVERCLLSYGQGETYAPVQKVE